MKPGNLLELVLSYHHWIPQTKVQSAGLVASAFTLSHLVDQGFIVCSNVQSSSYLVSAKLPLLLLGGYYTSIFPRNVYTCNRSKLIERSQWTKVFQTSNSVPAQNLSSLSDPPILTMEQAMALRVKRFSVGHDDTCLQPCTNQYRGGSFEISRWETRLPSQNSFLLPSHLPNYQWANTWEKLVLCFRNMQNIYSLSQKATLRV